MATKTKATDQVHADVWQEIENATGDLKYTAMARLLNEQKTLSELSAIAIGPVWQKQIGLVTEKEQDLLRDIYRKKREELQNRLDLQDLNGEEVEVTFKNFIPYENDEFLVLKGKRLVHADGTLYDPPTRFETKTSAFRVMQLFRGAETPVRIKLQLVTYAENADEKAIVKIEGKGTDAQRYVEGPNGRPVLWTGKTAWSVSRLSQKQRRTSDVPF